MSDIENAIAPRYLKLLSKHKIKIEKRIKEILSVAHYSEIAVKNKFSGFKPEINVDSGRLDTALTSYFLDIFRYKDFHGMKDATYINFPKIYSFSIKWILKEKPFYLVTNNQNFSKKDYKKVSGFLKISNSINELISVKWMQTNYNSHLKKGDDELVFGNDDISSLVYNMKFRDYSTGWMEQNLLKYIDASNTIAI